MPRSKDEPSAVRVYTVCDESRYLMVRNVPSLKCGEELSNLFATYGPVEDCRPVDGESCEPFTEVYWVKFQHVNNARFAKRKLDEFVFFGNQLQVSYAPQFESLSDTTDKLEGRRKEVLARIKSATVELTSQATSSSQQMNPKRRDYAESAPASRPKNTFLNHVSSDKEYFPSPSMNKTVQMVREKLDKIKSSGEFSETGPVLKKTRVDNRRRI